MTYLIGKKKQACEYIRYIRDMYIRLDVYEIMYEISFNIYCVFETSIESGDRPDYLKQHARLPKPYTLKFFSLFSKNTSSINVEL